MYVYKLRFSFQIQVINKWIIFAYTVYFCLVQEFPKLFQIKHVDHIKFPYLKDSCKTIVTTCTLFNTTSYNSFFQIHQIGSLNVVHMLYLEKHQKFQNWCKSDCDACRQRGCRCWNRSRWTIPVTRWMGRWRRSLRGEHASLHGALGLCGQDWSLSI